MHREILYKDYKYKGVHILIYLGENTIGTYYRGIIPSDSYVIEDKDLNIVIEVLEGYIDAYYRY